MTLRLSILDQSPFPAGGATDTTARLVAHMMKTYHISADRVIGHGDTKPTDCPGRNLRVAEVRRMATQFLVAEGVAVDQGNTRTASTGELLTEIKGR